MDQMGESGLSQSFSRVITLSLRALIQTISFRDGTIKPGGAGTSTQMPSLLSVAATWDPSLAALFGATVAEEFTGKGANMILGPQLCVHRTPYEGRNFERLSGEDPYLGSALVGPLVTAIQSKGVIANANIFIANSQEKNRTTDNAEVDDRTLHEIYLQPFEAAVKARVGSVMCSCEFQLLSLFLPSIFNAP